MLRCSPSLHEHVFKSRSVFSVPVAPTLTRPTGYKIWEDQQMKQAILAHQNGMSVRRAAAMYSILNQPLVIE